MAFSSLQFHKFDPSEDKIEHYLEHFHFHCVVHDFSDKKSCTITNIYKRKIIFTITRPNFVTNLTYKEVQTVLIHLYKERTNIITERFSFHRLCQSNGQPVKYYISELRTQANKCQFGACMQEALRDQLVFDICDNNLRKRLLSSDDLSWDSDIYCSTARSY